MWRNDDDDDDGATQADFNSLVRQSQTAKSVIKIISFGDLVANTFFFMSLMFFQLFGTQTPAKQQILHFYTF